MARQAENKAARGTRQSRKSQQKNRRRSANRYPSPLSLQTMERFAIGEIPRPSSSWPRFKIDYNLDLYDSRSLDNSEGWIDYLELFFLYLYLCVFSFFILLGEIVHPPLGHASKSIIADRDLYDSRSFDLSERWIDYLELLFLYIYLRVVSSFILLEKWRDRYWKDRPSSSWPPFKID